VRIVLQLICFACLFAAWVLGDANRTRYIILGAIALTAGIAWVVVLPFRLRPESRQAAA
jgi:hypothetical protein